jgi:hypothetical protein
VQVALFIQIVVASHQPLAAVQAEPDAPDALDIAEAESKIAEVKYEIVWADGLVPPHDQVFVMQSDVVIWALGKLENAVVVEVRVGDEEFASERHRENSRIALACTALGGV